MVPKGRQTGEAIPLALYGNGGLAVASSVEVTSRRLEDRIRELCAAACQAAGAELDAILKKLQAALQEHNRRFRKLAADSLVTGGKKQKDRRSA